LGVLANLQSKLTLANLQILSYHISMITNKKQLIARIPADLHKRAKILSAQTGEPLTQVVERLIREWTEKQEREKSK